MYIFGNTHKQGYKTLTAKKNKQKKAVPIIIK